MKLPVTSEELTRAFEVVRFDRGCKCFEGIHLDAEIYDNIVRVQRRICGIGPPPDYGGGNPDCESGGCSCFG